MDGKNKLPESDVSNTMDGFTRRKEHSKEQIRKAAWDLFSQFGVDRVSMNDIARKAGVSQATIYNNFENKEALAVEFVTTIVDQLVDSVQEALAPDMPFWEKLPVFIDFIVGLTSKTPSNVDRTVFTSSIDLQNDPKIHQIHKAAQQRMITLLLALVQQGKDQHEINLEITDASFAIYFKAFMSIFIDPELQHQFRAHPQLAKDVGILMMYGLGGKGKGKANHSEP
jgi:AcrR family transcriptional regulator